MSYLLIGLGNPGEKYKDTRHNAGKAFAGWVNKEQEARSKKQWNFEAVETECFMNESGSWLKSQLQKKARMAEMVKMAKNHNNSNHSSPSNHFDHLFIAHDDLDIPLGSFKIQFGKGPRLHKGILSVEQALGTKEFWRIRIGIENRKNKMAKMAKNGHNGFNHSSPSDHYNHLSASGSDYVLGKFKQEEKKILEAIYPEMLSRIKQLIFI